MPAYNAGEWLKETPRFALAQTFALAISISLVSCAAQSPSHPREHFSPALPKAGGQPSANNEIFPCNNKNSKTQTPVDPSSKHSVSLSWQASVSLSTPPADGEGYNLYRLNPDGLCTKINETLIRGTVYEDRFVELGRTYRYGAKAVKQNSESGLSNVAQASVPLT
jgi:hypothetical protein